MPADYHLSVKIDKSQTGGTFTNYDTVKGEVHLRIGSEITLTSIHVKLEGVSSTVMYIEKRNSNGRKVRRRLHCIHKLLYDTAIVFPPKNVRAVAKTSKFTLIPGEYTYPFEFKIPLNNSCFKEQMGHGELHSCNKLPPSLSGMGEFSNIKYFVKVTANRSNMFKLNLRSFDPFVFLPIDSASLMNRNDSQQSFVRKDFIIPNKIPDIVACYATPSSTNIVKYAKNTKEKVPEPQKKSQGFLKSLFFGPEPTQPAQPVVTPPKGNTEKKQYDPRPVYRPQVKPVNLLLYLEARFRYPAYMIPTKSPNFKLYLISKHSSQYYELPNGESSGLGYVYLKNLKIVLHMRTTIVIEGHVEHKTNSEVLLNYKGVNCRLDLHDVQRSNATDINNNQSKLYELEIPKEIYANAIVPDHIAPTFKSCNIERNYGLTIDAGFTSNKAVTKEDPLVKTSLYTDINIYSGLQAPQRAEGLTQYQANGQSAGVMVDDDHIPSSMDTSFTGVAQNDENLPSYDEALNENDQSDRRRRFRQSDNYYQDLS